MAGIFKAYDIRGIVPDQLGPDTVARIGNAWAQWLIDRRATTGAVGTGAPLRVGLGYDARPSSPELAAAFLSGARAAGAQTTCWGLVTTPMTYWANARDGLDGSVSLTASHNPHPYNGLKLSAADCIPIGSGSGMEEIEQAVHRLASCPNRARADTASLVTHDLLTPYVDWLATRARVARPMRIAVDAGNGMAGLDTPVFLNRLPDVRWEGLYMEPDGTFPNHEANPLKESTLRDLQERVRSGGFDFGVAFDGDADRCAFVDERGEVVRADALTGLLATDFLRQSPGRAVIHDLRLSRAVPEAIRSAGGTPIRSRVGHAYMKAAMRAHDGIFGGEFSAHYYYGDARYTDSGILTLIAVMNLLSADTAPLSERLRPFQRYPKTPEINFRVGDGRAALDAIRVAFTDATQDELDGISAVYPQGWINVRASNTEPLLRLNAEADTVPLLDQLVMRVRAALGPDAIEEHG